MRRVLFSRRALRTGALLSVLSLAAGCGAPPQSRQSAEPWPQEADSAFDDVHAQGGRPVAHLASEDTLSEDLSAQLKWARSFALQGDTAQASELFEALAGQGHAEGFYNLGVLAQWRGDDRVAQGYYQEALRVKPTFGEAVLAMGRLMIAQGRTTEALQMAEAALAGQPESLGLTNARDRVRLLSGGDHRAVMSSAKGVLRKDEKNVSAMINLAQGYARDGMHELALAILQNADALRPMDAEIAWMRAQAYQSLDEPRRARVVLEAQIASEGGGSAEVHNNLGLLYHEAGDFQGAEAQFREALRKAPQSAALYTNLGNALKGQQRFTEAAQALKRVAELEPKNADAYFNLGILYLDGAIPGLDPILRFEQAVAYLEQYQQLRVTPRPDDPVAEYIAEAQKRAEVERKRQEQMRNQPKMPAPQTSDDGLMEEAPQSGEGEADGELWEE